MPSATTAAVGWSVVLLLAGSFYWVSNQRKNKNRRTIAVKGVSKFNESKKQLKKRTRKDASHSGGEQERRQFQKPKNADDQLAIAEGNSRPVLPDDDQDAVDNREFARQLSNAKTGKIAVPKSQASSRPKSVKQGHAQEKQAIEISNITAPSSSTGNDADDDSPINSSDMSTPNGASFEGEGVLDMLENPTPPPGVLRVTSLSKIPQPEKPKFIKKMEPTETKKQRQNRQKAEEAKLARAEEEKARKVRMEQQRRIAREAERRAAKDGSTFMASQNPTSSVWKTSLSASGNSTSAIQNVELLDTYDIPSNTAPTSEPAHAKIEETGGARAQQKMAVLSEEEQVRFAIQETETWSIVKGKDKRKQTAKNKENETSKSDLKAKDEEKNSHYTTPPFVAPTRPSQVRDTAFSYFNDNDTTVHETHVLEDSEWEVS